MENESCSTCKHKYKLIKYDYSQGGCTYKDMEGYICMVFAKDRNASWMFGINENTGMCEGYERLEDN